MDRYISFALIEPFNPFLLDGNLRLIDTPIIRADLFEGTVELPSGKVVTADSFVRVGGSLRKFMQDWQDRVSGQHNPIYNDPIKKLKRDILYQLYSLRIESESSVERDAYEDAYKIVDEIL